MELILEKLILFIKLIRITMRVPSAFAIEKMGWVVVRISERFINLEDIFMCRPVGYREN